MNKKRAVAAAIAALLPFTGAALAQETAPAGDSNAELRREIDEQKQRLAILERKLEIQDETTKAAAAAAPRITANATRFQVGSPDNSNFIVTSEGQAPFGGAAASNDALIVRRATRVLEMKVELKDTCDYDKAQTRASGNAKCWPPT